MPITNPPSTGVNTGDATAADVAQGKTFSSASLTNASGTNTTNATVPSNAPIQPPQAFVDNALYYFGAGSDPGTVQIGFGGSSIKVTALDLNRFNIIAAWAASMNVPTGFGFGYQAILDVDSILSVLAASIANFTSSVSLTLYGPDMGMPTPSVAGVAGEWHLTITDVASLSFDVNTDSGLASDETAVSTDNSLVLAESSLTNIYQITIGRSDNPSPADVAAKIVELKNDPRLTASDATLIWADVQAQPWYFYNTPVGVTDYGTSGSYPTPNADLTTLINAGWHGDYADWTNGFGPQVVVSGAGTFTHNGTFIFNGIVNGKRSYVKTGGLTLSWSNQWLLGSLYVSPDDTAEPWGAAFVAVDPVDGPAPTVTLVSGSDAKTQVTF